jgi:hypothetical protein
MNDELGKIGEDAYKALNALYIATDENVARDVNEKVRKYISALENRCWVNSWNRLGVDTSLDGS